MKFLPLDKFKLVFLILYIVTVGIVVLAEIDIDKDIQDLLIVLTHLPAVALVIVLWDTLWVAVTVGIGVVMSILFHVAVIYDWNVENMEPLDIGFSNLTLYLVGFMVVFQRIPESALPFLFTITVLNVDFWDVQPFYMGVSTLFNTIVLAYVLYRLCNPSPNRTNGFLVLALIIGIVGTGFFLADGNHQSKNYAILHSVWHVCSYSGLYFILRSSNTEGIRVPRVEFTTDYTNILAYSDH